MNWLREVQNDGRMMIKGDWEEIEMAADSGATENVVGNDMLNDRESVPGAASKICEKNFCGGARRRHKEVSCGAGARCEQGNVEREQDREGRA